MDSQADMAQSKNDVLNMISAAVHDRPYHPISPEQWQEIYEELQIQSVHILPASILDSLQLPEEEKKRFKQATIFNLQSFYTVLKEQDAMLKYLDSQSIPSVILKGAAAAVNYPHPEYRCMGDIDVLVPVERFEDAYNVLAENYKPLSEINDFHRHTSFVTESGVEIELHKFFSESGNTKQDKLLDEMFYSAISNRVYTDIDGCRFPVLPPLENGIVLLTHIRQHLDSGLGLRQIIDWMYYVEKYLDDAMWEQFAPVADRVGVKKLAVISTAMCIKYLGLSSGIHWCDNAVSNPLCDDLMDFVLEHGNFGRKSGSTNTKTVSVIRLLRNPVRGLKIAQQTGLITWSAYKKHRWLKPFAWIYQIIRWIGHGIKNGNIVGLIRNGKRERVETTLLERLGVTR